MVNELALAWIEKQAVQGGRGFPDGSLLNRKRARENASPT